MKPKQIRFAEAIFIKSAVKPGQYPPGLLPEVAVVGRSNVGKSSLLNSLLNRKSLVKVSRTPGRTQLINFFSIEERLMLVDLPGYGYAKVPNAIRRQWQPMIEKYFLSRQSLVGCLLLLDIRRVPSEDDLMLWDWLRQFDIAVVPVLTKGDKLSAQKNRNQQRVIAAALDVPLEALILTSAKTHKGRDRLRETISGLCWGVDLEALAEAEAEQGEASGEESAPEDVQTSRTSGEVRALQMPEPPSSDGQADEQEGGADKAKPNAARKGAQKRGRKKRKKRK